MASARLANALAGSMASAALKDAFGVGWLPGAPEELPQRELRGHRLRVGRDGLPERGLGLREVAAGRLDGAEVGLPGRGRVELQRLLHLLQRAVEVLEARQRVGAQHERVDVLRVDGERLVGARLRVLGPPGQQQQRARLAAGRPRPSAAGPPRAPTRRARRRRSPAAGRRRPASGAPARTSGPSHRVAVLQDGGVDVRP